jgi:hypothetical protein
MRDQGRNRSCLVAMYVRALKDGGRLILPPSWLQVVELLPEPIVESQGLALYASIHMRGRFRFKEGSTILLTRLVCLLIITVHPVR